jgi:methionyl aminopeptidase
MTIIKSPAEVELMRKVGKIVAAILEKLSGEVRPGIKTKHLDSVAENELKKAGAIASFKGYRGYPASLCVSINEEIVHGIPGDRTLVAGDIVSLDFGAYLGGFHGDSAITVGVGDISAEAKKLLSVTKTALMLGIQAAKTGSNLGDVSHTIQEYVESNGLAVVKEYCGHGVGRNLHEDPQIPNFGEKGMGPILKKGMTLALEPMVTLGDWRTRVDQVNKWTVRTADRSLAAHFEHTIAIGDTEPEILTII